MSPNWWLCAWITVDRQSDSKIMTGHRGDYATTSPRRTDFGLTTFHY